MRICLISREFPPDTGWGGVGAYTYQTSRALAKKGHEVEVIALKGSSGGNPSRETVIENGVTVHRVDWESALDELNLMLVGVPSSHYVLKSGIALWRRFLEIHSAKPFDIVEAPEHLGAGVFHASTKVAPLLTTLHTPHSKFVTQNLHSAAPSFDNRIICLLERLSILHSDVVASPSNDLARFVSNDCGYAFESIELIRNPVDTTIFRPEGPNSIESDRTKVLFVGRLEERKGVQHLAQAIPIVLNRINDVEFIFVGADTNTAPQLRSMKSYIQSLLKGHEDCIRFIPHVELSDMPNYYRSADICVIPSLYDNAPYTCIEALASGKPVIVSSAGGTKEYVVEGETGIMVEAGNSEDLANAILKLASQKELRTAFGTRAREFAETNLGLDLYAEEKLRLYQLAIQRFASRKSDALYRHKPEQTTMDSIELLCAFDSMIFDICYKLSLDFRIRYWLRLLRSRPKFALAKLLLASATGLGFRPEQISFLGWLSNDVNLRSANPYESTKKWSLSLSKLDPDLPDLSESLRALETVESEDLDSRV